MSSLAAKITDLGLARKGDEATRTRPGAVVGAPSYMALEHAATNKSQGPAADVYPLRLRAKLSLMEQ